MRSVIFGSDNSNPDTVAASYNCINATIFSSWSSNQNLRRVVVPGPMTLSNYYLQTDVPPGLGASYTFTVLKNGSPTSLAIVIADTATTGSDTTHSVSFAAGDTLSLQSTPSNSPATLSVESWNMLVDTPDQTAPVLSMSGAPSTSTTNYGVLTGGQAASNGWSATESDMQIVVPTSGALSNLYNVVSAAPGSGKSWQYTLMVNGSATALQTTLSGTATTANNTANSVNVSAGDTISLRCVPSGTPTSSLPTFSMTFTPTVNGESFFGYGSAAAPLAGTSYEQPLGLGNNAWTANEANRPMLFGPYTITKMYIKLNTAPGAGTSRVFTVRKAAANTALTATIADTATTANVASNVAFAQGNQLTLQSATGTGSPATATGGVHAGFLIYMPPPPTTFVPQIMIY